MRRPGSWLKVVIDDCKLGPPQALTEHIAARFASVPAVGIMLHHAAMDDADLAPRGELPPVPRTAQLTHRVAMRALLPADAEDVPARPDPQELFA